MKFTKWFKVNGEDREFMLYWQSKEPIEVLQCIEQIKSQDDLYRTTRNKNGTIHLWDART